MNNVKKYATILNKKIDKGLTGNKTPGYPQKNNLETLKGNNIDSLICKMMYNYLSEESDFIADDSNAINVISKYLRKRKEEVKSLYKGLMLRVNEYSIILEYLEPKYSEFQQRYIDRKFSFEYNGKETKTHSYVETTPDVKELTLETLPFKQKRIEDIILYIEKIYQGIEQEKGTDTNYKKLIKNKKLM